MAETTTHRPHGKSLVKSWKNFLEISLKFQQIHGKQLARFLMLQQQL
jgi:hypothetical protein